MFLARLILTAWLLAFEGLCFLDLFRRHLSQFKMFRVVQFVARDHPAVFSAPASLFNQNFASLALIIVALLCALMELTRKEFLAYALANRYLISAFPSLLAEKSNNLSTSARAILDSSRSLLARLAGAFMTHFLAIVFPTIQRFPADVMTHELLAAAFHALFSSSTEALHIYVNIAFLALTLMTLLFAVMS